MDLSIYNISARVCGAISGAGTPGPGLSNVSAQCQCEGNFTDDDGEEN